MGDDLYRAYMDYLRGGGTDAGIFEAANALGYYGEHLRMAVEVVFS